MKKRVLNVVTIKKELAEKRKKNAKAMNANYGTNVLNVKICIYAIMTLMIRKAVRHGKIDRKI